MRIRALSTALGLLLGVVAFLAVDRTGSSAESAADHLVSHSSAQAEHLTVLTSAAQPTRAPHATTVRLRLGQDVSPVSQRAAHSTVRPATAPAGTIVVADLATTSSISVRAPPPAEAV